MNKILVKLNDSGECISTANIDDIANNGDYEEVEGLEHNCTLYHRQPYLSEYRLGKIREKQKEIIKNFHYVFGLSEGLQLDGEAKTYIEKIITFTEQYKNRIITETMIELPPDLDGHTETIEF